MITMGNFNMKTTDILKFSMDINLIKIKSCFKGQASCVDLTLTNRNFVFTISSLYETGVSDPHPRIYTVLKRVHFQKQNLNSLQKL